MKRRGQKVFKGVLDFEHSVRIEDPSILVGRRSLGS